MKTFALLFFGFATATVHAGPIEELKSVSALSLDLQKLQQGEIAGERGALGNFPRGAYAENAFFVRANPAAVAARIAHWDPTKHGQTDVRLYREYSWPASPEVWSRLILNLQHAKDRWLIDRTAQRSPELHLTDVERTNSPTNPSEFWRQILRSRDAAISSGGLAAVPIYLADSTRIEIAAEIQNLLKMTPAIASRFGSILKTPANPYWEASEVRGHIGLQAGFISSQKTAAGFQLADCGYYTSDTYFCSLALYELWPIANGTLVWQIDYVSAPFRSFTAGVDRIFASREMIKDTAQTAKLLRADLEKN